MTKPREPSPLMFALTVLALVALAFLAGRWWGMQGG